MTVDKRQHDRLMLLYLIYKESIDSPVNLQKIAFDKGIKNGNYMACITWLFNEKLITGSVAEPVISHEGIKNIEAAILNPDARSTHFPPLKELDEK